MTRTASRAIVAVPLAILAGCGSLPTIPTGPTDAVALDRHAAAAAISAYRRAHGRLYVGNAPD